MFIIVNSKGEIHDDRTTSGLEVDEFPGVNFLGLHGNRSIPSMDLIGRASTLYAFAIALPQQTLTQKPQKTMEIAKPPYDGYGKLFESVCQTHSTLT